MPINYSAWGAIPRGLKEGMNAFQEAKAAAKAEEMAAAQAGKADKQQSFENDLALQKLAIMRQGAAAKVVGRPLGAQTAEEIGDRLAIPTELQRNAADVKANPKLLGPENWLATSVPFLFSERKDVASKVGSIRKLAARAIEGARLTDSDMAYYTKNLPSETDTPKEFDNKTKNLVGLLARATSQRVGSLGKAGFNISGYESDMANLAELGKQTGETGQGNEIDPLVLQQAQEALDDPMAPPEAKARAQEILRGMM